MRSFTSRRVHPLGNIMGFWEVEANARALASVILACIRRNRYADGVPDRRMTCHQTSRC
jgi:hypothetical protein